jgi:hypothetical protein
MSKRGARFPILEMKLAGHLPKHVQAGRLTVGNPTGLYERPLSYLRFSTLPHHSFWELGFRRHKVIGASTDSFG